MPPIFKENILMRKYWFLIHNYVFLNSSYKCGDRVKTSQVYTKEWYLNVCIEDVCIIVSFNKRLIMQPTPIIIKDNHTYCVI